MSFAAVQEHVSVLVQEDGNRYASRKPVLGPAVPRSAYDVAFDAEGMLMVTGEDGPRYLGRLPIDDPLVIE